MSYDLGLQDPVTHKVLEIDEKHHIRGGMYQLGGSYLLRLNVTYNYAEILGRVIPNGGIRRLYGKSAAESIPILHDAINQLGDAVDDDYWKATEGNVKRALHGMLAFAQMRPDGVWDGY